MVLVAAKAQEDVLSALTESISNLVQEVRVKAFPHSCPPASLALGQARALPAPQLGSVPSSVLRMWIISLHRLAMCRLRLSRPTLL